MNENPFRITLSREIREYDERYKIILWVYKNKRKTRKIKMITAQITQTGFVPSTGKKQKNRGQRMNMKLIRKEVNEDIKANRTQIKLDSMDKWIIRRTIP